MKSFVALPALLLSVASAAPLQARQAAPTEFDVTSFSANTTPHGTGAYLSYDIDIPGILSTSCSYHDQTSAVTLPAIPFTACDDPAVQWEFHQESSQPGGSGQYLMVITYQDATGRKWAGSKEWPSSDFPIEQYGASFNQFYRGQPDFAISNVS